MRRPTPLIALLLTSCLAAKDGAAPPPEATMEVSAAKEGKAGAKQAPASSAPANGEAAPASELGNLFGDAPAETRGFGLAEPSPTPQAPVPAGGEADELLGALGRKDKTRRDVDRNVDQEAEEKSVVTVDAPSPRATVEGELADERAAAEDGDLEQAADGTDDLPGAKTPEVDARRAKVKPKKLAMRVDDITVGDEEQAPTRRPRRGLVDPFAPENGPEDGPVAKNEAKDDDGWRGEKPAAFLPRFGYFENTYLGGDAAWAERARRLGTVLHEDQRPYLLAALAPQPFDPPGDAGLGVSAQLDVGHVERPGRVFLQVGLQGSARFGWRRPPLDVVLVADAAPALVDETLLALVRRLGAQDRLGLVAPGLDLAPAPPSELRRTLAARLEAREPRGERTLGDALRSAGALLADAAGAEARVPGTQLVLVLTTSDDTERVASAAAAAHALSLQGAVTSVLEAGHRGVWWSVASAGHGSYHHLQPGAALATVDAELEAVARVVARLVRVNVRLAPGVQAIRVVGSRLLDRKEVVEVKAREVATDRNLSRTLGVTADRGDDDDGLQTVVPYFLGGDAHVVLLELWVEKPGPVADVTVRYKDMVSLTNSTARASVSLAATPRPETPFQRAVRGNLRGFEVAAALGEAAAYVRRGDAASALEAIDRARPLARDGRDARVLDGFTALLRSHGSQPVVADALDLGRARRIGLAER